MIGGLKKTISADYYISVTGIAGPDGGSREKPVGTVFIGFGKIPETLVFKFLFNGFRESIRMWTAMRVFEIIWEELIFGKPDNKSYTSLVDYKKYKSEIK